MSLIDWSDADEMLGLLADYVRDAREEERSDPVRAKFLRSLSSAIDTLASDSPLSSDLLLARLRAIAEDQPHEFLADEVLGHVFDCIRELERIVSQESDHGTR